MKNGLIILLAALLLYSCGNSGNGKNNKVLLSADMINNPAQIKFDTTIHDFGKIPEGDKVKYEFKFTNISKNPLVITEVHASCGCTTPEWPKDIIKPGQSNIISVQYDSEGREGKFKKGITVTSNTIPNQTLLVIQGEVI